MTALNPDHAVLVRAADAEVLHGTTTVHLLADGSDTGGVISAARSRMPRDTAGASPHHHRNAAEMFFVIEGGLDVLVGDRVVTARAGDFLLVPPGMAHAFRTPADTGADFLFLMPEVDRFDYFRLLNRVQQGLASPQEILDSQERFDNHFHESPVWTEHCAGR
ncbi:cupin domain-containing protein [Goodfellowiella coeruleoviolacea]|uniref:Cupin domain-containing protein n=1 Tax=Goodfellowiella coeruleoviolacea TaxID=334858 RepID=A0AAE3GK47_9PSEU|nr:cupin domain-containing protein [Goodfellowiella coeruleoviolacea]MCP2169742.1 Cupin domain-containing protein [Goodfellowiella coeruleoviolacea]